MRSVRLPLAVLAVALATGAGALWIRSPQRGLEEIATPVEVRGDGVAPNRAELVRAPELQPELAPAAGVVESAPSASDRRKVDAAPPEHMLVVIGRAVDRVGQPVAHLDVTAAVHDSNLLRDKWLPTPRFVRARAPTDVHGRFELWIESHSFVNARRVALRLSGVGEEGFGGASFVVAQASAPAEIEALRADTDNRLELGSVVMRAVDRLIASGRYELVGGEPVPASRVRTTLELDATPVGARARSDAPDENGYVAVHNEQGEFALYADRASGTHFELASRFADGPQPAPLVGAVGTSGLRVVFQSWASVRGALLSDFALDARFLVACRVESDDAFPEVLRAPVRIDSSGRFEFARVPAGRCSLHLVSDPPGPDGGPFATLDLRWGEQRELGVIDLRGDWGVGRLDVRDARGQPASGWAVVEPGDRAPFGFVRELSTALPASARRVHVYVPGHRIASVDWPPEDPTLQLDEGPVLDLGFGACGQCCMSERGLDLDLEPVAFDDPGAQHFTRVMRLLPVSCANRANVRLPCAGTYRLSYKPQRRADVAALTRSYDIDVPIAGRSFDP